MKSSGVTTILWGVGLFLMALVMMVSGISCKSQASPSPSPGSPTSPAPGTTSAILAPNGVDINGYSFKPATLNIKVGTTVTWADKDPDAHTVTARDKSFDSGSLSAGGTFSYTFRQSGTFEYFCAFHPSMTARIVVE